MKTMPQAKDEDQDEGPSGIEWIEARAVTQDADDGEDKPR